MDNFKFTFIGLTKLIQKSTRLVYYDRQPICTTLLRLMSSFNVQRELASFYLLMQGVYEK